MYGERKYIVNMNMSFCFESSGACFLTFSILSDTLLPKALCSWENTPGELNFNMSITLIVESKMICVSAGVLLQLYVIECSSVICYIWTGFSLSAWKTGKGLNPADPLSAWAQATLFEELGMAQYLTSSECARGSGLYVDSMSGGSNIGFNTNQSTYSQCKTFLCTLWKVESRIPEIYKKKN